MTPPSASSALQAGVMITVIPPAALVVFLAAVYAVRAVALRVWCRARDRVRLRRLNAEMDEWLDARFAADEEESAP